MLLLWLTIVLFWLTIVLLWLTILLLRLTILLLWPQRVMMYLEGTCTTATLRIKWGLSKPSTSINTHFQTWSGMPYKSLEWESKILNFPSEIRILLLCYRQQSTNNVDNLIQSWRKFYLEHLPMSKIVHYLLSRIHHQWWSHYIANNKLYYQLKLFLVRQLV